MAGASAGSSVRVSVVVPVWNPGPNLIRCVDSLLAQTMPARDYEIVLVDDGSTDGTAQRLDDLADAHPDLVRVLHIPASGWPGKPRNVGIEAAGGDYVHLVDNDDTLPPYALQALYDAGVAAGADVVLGTPVSDFRRMNSTLYRRSIASTTLAECPELTETLTPHKMFRRELLLRHDIRFPEGPVPLEDQMFVMRAYLHAAAIAVLADRPYYFYLRRIGSGRNAGERRIDPVIQFRAQERVLDIVEAHVRDPQLRDRLFRRFYRLGFLARLTEQSMLDYDETRQLAVVEEIRRIVTSRFGPDVNGRCGAAHRVQGALLLQGDVSEIVELAAHYRNVTLRARARAPQWRDGTLRLDVNAALYYGDEPLRCERAGEGWALPETLAPGVALDDRLLDPARDEPDVEVSVTARATSITFGITDGLHLGVHEDGIVRATGTVAVDPARGLGGVLEDGVWGLRLRIRFAGFNRSSPIELEPGAELLPYVTRSGVAVVAYLSDSGALLLDVGQWTKSLAGQLAASVRLAIAGRGALRVTVRADLAGVLRLQLLLVPSSTTSGGLLVCAGEVSSAGGGRVELPPLPRDGSWQAWLRVPDSPAVPPASLPWQVRSTNSRVSVESS